jgi:addiction module HigA family antidote
MAIQLHDSFFTHPGFWLKTEIIDAHQLQIVDAAKRLNVTRQALSALVNGRAGLSAEMAIRFEKVFGLDAATSLQMQTRYDLAQARARADEIVVEGVLAA